MKRIVATAVAVLALLAVPGVAFAGGSSTCSSYNPQLCQVVVPTNASNTNVPTGSSSASSTPVAQVSASTDGSLPFTGLDLGLVAVGGVVLIGAGLVARRLSAER